MSLSRFLSLLCPLLLLTGLDAQEVKQAAKPAAKTAAKPPVNQERLQQLIIEAQQLHARKRIGEAFDKINEADALQPDNPMVNNVLGTLYTAIRDFDKARVAFKKAGAKSPGAFEPEFNLAELDYVQARYPAAEARFAKLLVQFEKLRMDVRHLTQFKVIVCQLKQNKTKQADALMKSFTFMDDTPAFYFANAAMSYHQGNETKAQEWIKRANRIFRDGQNSPYMDTLMEAHWIPSMTVPDKEKGEL